MRSVRTVVYVILLPLMAAIACDQTADRLTVPGDSGAANPSSLDLSVAATSVYVSNVDELYAAVNDAANSGAAIILAPGTYLLSATNAGVARPNGGRLELQQDMSLYGVTGNRSAVVIDGSAIPASSLTVSFGRTGIIRVGRGSNTIEWLTVLGNPNAAAGIASELPGTSPTRIRVAHVISGGSSRGIDIRNVSAANAGRRIDAELTENELFGPTTVVGMSEGIRISNFVGADGGVVSATMSGNRVHGFMVGCIFANNRSSRAALQVRSSGDKFFGNTLGCFIAGGLSQATTGLANSSLTMFEAHGSEFVDNTSTIPNLERGGIAVYGGISTTQSDVASNNTVQVSLWGVKVARNQDEDFIAFGAFKENGVGLAGTGNHVTINLNGVSRQIDVTATPSFPVDPNGTNTVAVMR